MGIYVEVKLHDGTVLGTMEILREKTEVQSTAEVLDTYSYRYKMSGVDPVTKSQWGYEGMVEHDYYDWVWALVGKVLNDKGWT